MKSNHNPRNSVITLIFITAMLSACGAPNFRTDLQNLPSLVEIVALDFKNNSIKLRVSHRNKTTREGNQLSCQLAIKDYAPISINALNLPNLTNYATETVESQIPLEQLKVALDQHSELPYVLDCFLFSTNFRKEQVIKKSIIYATPGEPWVYR